MGRTRRKRRSKGSTYKTCGNNNEVILLNTWLKHENCECNRKLVLANFNETGRGVLTKKKIYAGEELISLPLNLTINVTTILMDERFKNIFLRNESCFRKYKKSISFQSFLAFYVIYLKFLGRDTKWYIYLKTLPKEYTVPYFLPNEVKSYLSKDILSIISNQEEVIESSFKIFRSILDDLDLLHFKEDFTKSKYEWAYFTVNTRCVYMDLTKILDLNYSTNSVLELLNDNTNIALCPYLDMINHSLSARNETKLILNSDIHNLKIANLNEQMFSNVQFNLYTKNKISAFKEVFICYGDSHNLKLVTEYGFFLPNNHLDSVNFKFDSIYQYFISKNIKLSEEQLQFINSHDLNKDLYIDCKGLSFNFYALLMVVKYYYKQNSNVSSIIYSSNGICSEQNSLHEVIVPFLKDKIASFNKEISNLNSCEYKNCILDNCLALMCQYVNILEKFIKC